MDNLNDSKSFCLSTHIISSSDIRVTHRSSSSSFSFFNTVVIFKQLNVAQRTVKL